jgi:2-C-methyl-D-erythritol 4-phosphate cytidylyltransferase
MGGTNKLFADLGGMPVVARSLSALDASRCIDEIVVAAREEDILAIWDACRQFGLRKVTHVVKGGATRLQSVLGALDFASPKAEFVAVHDAARPLASPALIENVAALAVKYGAAAPAVPPKDTVYIKNAKAFGQAPARSDLLLVQTPQVFRAELLRGALARAAQEGWDCTDDVSAVMRMGMTVFAAEGSYANIKITTPEDLAIAEALSERFEVGV